MIPKEFKNKRLIFYDFETTGLWNWLNQPIQVHFKMVQGNKISEYTAYVKCNYKLSRPIKKITGITDEILQTKGQDIKKVFREIKKLIFKDDNFILIGHNIIPFDNLFLNYYLQKFFTLKYQVDHSMCFDTAAHFKAMKIKAKKPDDLSYGQWHKKILNMKRESVNYSLQKACDFYKIKYINAHNASADVNMMFNVFTKQIKNIK